MQKIAAALIEAQKELPLVLGKDSKGHYNDYVSLERIIESVRLILNKHGLSLTQTGDMLEGQLLCRTRLIHSSGEFVEGAWPGDCRRQQ